VTPTISPAAFTLVDEHDGKVAGHVRVHRLGRIGYVRDLVVTEPARGAALIRAAAAALRHAGVREWHVHVSPDSACAIELGEDLGIRPAHRSAAVRVPLACVGQLPREPAEALPVTTDEVEDIERELGLVAGQIALWTRCDPHVLVQLRDASLAPVGFAAFDPAVNRARMFRVARPTFAAPLLEALAPHVRFQHLALVIDDDDALTDLLVAHGAEVERRMLHYSGALP
jgi:hypothetical protein